MNYIVVNNEKKIITDLKDGEFGGTFISFDYEMREIKNLNGRPIEILMAEEIGEVMKYYYDYIDILGLQ